MRALQVAVVAMAVVLVAGFATLFVTWGRRHLIPATTPAAAPPDAAVPSAADARVPIPAGGRVVQVDSADAWLDVLVENPDGSRDLLQVRRATGRVAGTLRFRPAAP